MLSSALSCDTNNRTERWQSRGRGTRVRAALVSNLRKPQYDPTPHIPRMFPFDLNVGRYREWPRLEAHKWIPAGAGSRLAARPSVGKPGATVHVETGISRFVTRLRGLLDGHTAKDGNNKTSCSHAEERCRLNYVMNDGGPLLLHHLIKSLISDE